MGKARVVELGRTKTDEFERAFETARECESVIIGKIAGEGGSLALAVKGVIADGLALL